MRNGDLLFFTQKGEDKILALTTSFAKGCWDHFTETPSTAEATASALRTLEAFKKDLEKLQELAERAKNQD